MAARAKTPNKDRFVVSSVAFGTQPLSATALVTKLQTPGNYPEATVHRPSAQYPFMNVEFHGRAGFSILIFERPRSLGYLATGQSTPGEPKVLVCLGGQVIEKWPEQLFLGGRRAAEVIRAFMLTGKKSPSCKWTRLDRFRRETVHPGGKGLIRAWKELSALPSFPFT